MSEPEQPKLIPCACKALHESVQGGELLRARCDALRVVYAALAPFDSDVRGRIMRAVHALYEGVTAVEVDDADCTCPENERVPDPVNPTLCGNCLGML